MKNISFMPRTPSTIAETLNVDVTPVMNMFIILIPFLVSMAVFTHLSIIEFTLPPNVGAAPDSPTAKPTLKITAVVASQYLAITRGEEMLDSIPLVLGQYDFSTFVERLSLRRAASDIQEEVIVAAADDVAIKHVVTVIDKCREAGFERIGVSSASDGKGTTQK